MDRARTGATPTFARAGARAPGRGHRLRGASGDGAAVVRSLSWSYSPPSAVRRRGHALCEQRRTDRRHPQQCLARHRASRHHQAREHPDRDFGLPGAVRRRARHLGAADDVEGFTISLPDKTWQRQANGNQVDYTPDGGKHFVRIAIDDSPDFPTPYAHQQDLEQQLTKLVDYHQVQPQSGRCSATARGLPGGLHLDRAAEADAVPRQAAGDPADVPQPGGCRVRDLHVLARGGLGHGAPAVRRDSPQLAPQDLTGLDGHEPVTTGLTRPDNNHRAVRGPERVRAVRHDGAYGDRGGERPCDRRPLPAGGQDRPGPAWVSSGAPPTSCSPGRSR